MIDHVEKRIKFRYDDPIAYTYRTLKYIVYIYVYIAVRGVHRTYWIVV